MDPVGPWYSSYNRLADPSGISNTFQTTTSTSTDRASNQLARATEDIQTGTSTTTPQLLVQAAHTTPTLAGQPSPFNPGGFLSSPGTGYDVFSPFFHHSNPKQTTHYGAQHAQPIDRAQAVTTSKPSSPVESNISSMRSNYASPPQNDVRIFFYNDLHST